MARGDEAAAGAGGDGNDDGEASAESLAQAQAETRFQSEVETNLRRNFAVHVMHGLLGQTGFRIIQAPTFLPAYVFFLSGSTSLVGLARSCQALGMFLTPILGATLIEHRRRVMPMVFATGAGMRLQVLGLSLCGFFLGAEANMIAVCALLGLFGFFTGMQSVTFSVLVSKVIPVERRGSLVGLRNSLAGLTAAVVGVIGGVLVDKEVFGNGYASVFLVSFILTASGLLSLLLMREPESPTVKRQSGLGARLRELPALLSSDGDFRAYMLARALGASGRMAMPYYVLYASAEGGVDGSRLGWLTGAFLISQTGSNLLWGLIADRQGFRNVLAMSLVAWIGATLVILFSPSFEGTVVAFVGLGTGLGGFMLACTNLVLEFGKREDVPMRIAMAQSAEQAVSVVAPLLGGVLAASVGYPPLFWTAASLQTIALVVTVTRVAEPRRRPLNAA
ncbi:MAG: MFS transporter [Myxococcales bacterium]|nr:MFS transporter [Myxococcales bacterium]